MDKIPLETARGINSNTHVISRMEKLGIDPITQLKLIEFRTRLTPRPKKVRIARSVYDEKYAPSWNSTLIVWGVAQGDEAVMEDIGDEALNIIGHFANFDSRTRGGVKYNDIGSTALLLACRTFIEDNFLQENEAALAGVIGSLLEPYSVNDSRAWQSYLDLK